MNENKKYVHINGCIIHEHVYNIIENHAQEHSCSFVESLEDLICKSVSLQKILNYNMCEKAEVKSETEADLTQRVIESYKARNINCQIVLSYIN